MIHIFSTGPNVDIFTWLVDVSRRKHIVVRPKYNTKMFNFFSLQVQKSVSIEVIKGTCFPSCLC